MKAGVEAAGRMSPEWSSGWAKRLGVVLRFAVILALAVGSPTWAANSVVVESKGVQGGTQNVQIGIFLSNDVNLRNVVLPFTLRSVIGGAFITQMSLKRNTSGRLDSSLTTINITNGYYADADTTIACKDAEPTRGFKNIAWNDTGGHPVVQPPVACLFSFGLIAPGEAPLASGSDGLTPSLLITVDIADSVGQFEIDSTCVAPSNHLSFVQDIINPPILVPDLSKGLITVTSTAVQYLGGDGIPRDYSLDQNYPNPFNASTVIKFNTKHDGNVRLEVFNILGQKVTTLVDEFRRYGPQAADWDGTDMYGQTVPTGLYFYRLVTSDFTEVRKMVLIK